jgi:hypothetical protein
MRTGRPVRARPHARPRRGLRGVRMMSGGFPGRMLLGRRRFTAEPPSDQKIATASPCECSALVLGAQHCDGVLEAVLEDRIGERSVRQGAGDLQRSDHHGEDTERLHLCHLQIFGCPIPGRAPSGVAGSTCCTGCRNRFGTGVWSRCRCRGEAASAGSPVQIRDQVAGWGEHDRVQSFVAVGLPRLEQVLGSTRPIPKPCCHWADGRLIFRVTS